MNLSLSSTLPKGSRAPAHQDAGTPTISIGHVSKTYGAAGSIHALTDVSLTVRHNEFISLLGPSGCGKSTLLNILAGFEQPTAGSARVNGVAVSAPHPSRAVVFQEAALLPWLTVWENIVFGPKACRILRKEYEPLANELLNAVGLNAFRHAYPSQLSGGMRQRVGIARALVMRPSVLLMDEPFGALDAQTRLQMQALLLDVWSEYKSTIVFVTHDVDEAVLLSDVIYVMSPRPGRVSEKIDVPLPRPRSIDLLVGSDFTRIRQQAFQAILHLHEEVNH